ncbi:MAG TPA: hypothetical protein DCW68_04235 [Rhodospirillaceae bacterium]|nr:MAG: hypothetical protein A2018_07420 [Alphaproteobacteria bacterium GWF2_58_20]HAU29304.1 hypothetical protein [Rhodospirillaceae bacterium]
MTDKTLNGDKKSLLWTPGQKIWVSGKSNPRIAHISTDEKRLVVAEWWQANGMRIVETFLKEIMQTILPLSNEAVEDAWQKNREQIQGMVSMIPLEDVAESMQSMQAQGIVGKLLETNADALGHALAEQAQMQMLPGMSESVSRISQELQNKSVIADEDRRLQRVLVLPGGGVRGIVMLEQLVALEEKLGKPICKCFDLIAGTSTGGIIGLALARPDPNNPGEPMYTAKNILDFYVRKIPEIMPPPWFESMNNVRMAYGPKFSREGMDFAAKELLGDTRLYEVLTSVIVPAYNIDKSEAVFFKYMAAYKDPDRDHPDFYMKDVARATSAAPLTFDPVVIHSIPNTHTGNNSIAYGCTDGGLFANNPSMVALIDAYKRLNENSNDILLVTLGTGFETLHYSCEKLQGKGVLGWAYALIDMMMKGQSDVAHHHCQKVLGEGHRYFRMDYPVDCEHLPPEAKPSIALDNAKPDNIQKLQNFGKFVARFWDDKFNRIAELIKEDDRRRAADSLLKIEEKQPPEKASRHPIDQHLGKRNMLGPAAKIVVPACVPAFGASFR